MKLCVCVGFERLFVVAMFVNLRNYEWAEFLPPGCIERHLLYEAMDEWLLQQESGQVELP